MPLSVFWLHRMHSVYKMMRPIDGVAWFLCLLVTFVSPAKTAEPIEMPFGGWLGTRVGQGTIIRWGSRSSPQEGAILGLTDGATHWKAIKINDGDSGTAATGCNASDWSVSQYIVPPWKIGPCDAAFRQNSLTTCYLSSTDFHYYSSLYRVSIKQTVLIHATDFLKAGCASSDPTESVSGLEKEMLCVK